MRGRRPGRAAWLTVAALLTGLSWAYVRHPPGRFTGGGLVHGDGVYYYVYLRSLTWGGDVDFSDDYAALGNPHNRGVGPRGLPLNSFTIGAAITWLPTFAVARATVKAGAALGRVKDDPGDGTSALSQRITLFASVLCAAGAALATIALAGRYVRERWACVGAAAAVVATPLLWYAVYQPSFSHAASALAVATFVWAWDRGRHARSVRGWAGLGALLGWVALIRPQDAVFGLLPAIELGRLWRWDRREAITAAVVFAAALVVTFSPQMLVWWTIYGKPLTVPQGEDFMLWDASKWAFTLFSSRNGLISWTPLVGLSLLGLVAMIRRRKARELALGLLLVFAAEAYVNGAVDDWWGGWAFGGRRFVGCTVMFGLGCAALLAGAAAALARRSRTTAAAVVGAVPLFWGLMNVSLVYDYLYGEVARGKSQAMRPATGRAFERGLDWLYGTFGHPGAIPANWMFAWRAGVSPDRYDLVSGFELVETRDNSRGRDTLWFDDPRWGMAGFGPRTTFKGQRASLVEGTEATFVLPMRRPAALRGKLWLAPASPDARVRVRVGGITAVDAALAEGWQVVPIELPAAALAAGLNYVAVEQSFAAEVPEPRTIGSTGAVITLEVTLESDARARDRTTRATVGRASWDLGAPGVHMLTLPPVAPPRTWKTADARWAGDHFARAIADIPEGTSVAVVISGRGTRFFNRAARAALESLGGGRQRLTGADLEAYVLLGVKGAPVGSALEERSPQGRATLIFGRSLDERAVGVAWGRLELERAEP